MLRTQSLKIDLKISGMKMFHSLDQFIKVIQTIKTTGMRSELVGSCVVHWTAKWQRQRQGGELHMIWRCFMSSKLFDPWKNGFKAFENQLSFFPRCKYYCINKLRKSLVLDNTLLDFLVQYHHLFPRNEQHNIMKENRMPLNQPFIHNKI